MSAQPTASGSESESESKPMSKPKSEPEPEPELLSKIIKNALDKYKELTCNDLIDDPPTKELLRSCESPSDFLAVLKQRVPKLDPSQNSDRWWSKCLETIVDTILAFSRILEAGVSLVCLQTQTYLKSALSHLSGRHTHRRIPYLPQFASSFQCVSFLLPSYGPL
jgi:hypothetical protein